MERYQYEALPPILSEARTPPYTRLMVLYPGQTATPIHCSLMIANLENCPRYEALSYHWGPSTGTMEPHVICNYRPLAITPNLNGALRSMRYPDRQRLLWVDAICIDQENLGERGRQVGYMRLVYKYAYQVIVWLGPKTEGVEKAFDLAQRMTIFREIPSEAEEFSINELLGMSEIEFDMGLFCLSDLFDREYFVRTWCVQEIVASSSHIAKCEDLEMNFIDLLFSSREIVHRRGEVMSKSTLEFWNGVYINKTKLPDTLKSEVEGSFGPLLILLAGFRDFKATNPVDKIYGLFGMSDEGIAPHLARIKIMGNNNTLGLRILRKTLNTVAEFANENSPSGSSDFSRHAALTPDYNKNTMEVYRDLVRFLLRSSPRVLDSLCHVQHTEDPSTRVDQEWPSWVAKWYEPRQVSLIGAVGAFLAGFCDGHFRYFANIQDNPLIGQAAEPNKLKLEGFKIDRVTKVTDVAEFGVHDEWPAEAIWTQLFPHIKLFPQSESETMPSYRNGDRLDVAFLLTAAVAPLGLVMLLAHTLIRDPNNGFDASMFGNAAVPATKARARQDAMAYILANTPLDTTQLPQYAAINQEAAEGNLSAFDAAVRSFSNNRRFFLTQSGYLGVGPSVMKPGDELCVLFGGRAPFVLRPNHDHHILIGECYVYDEDIMWGKATEDVRRRKTGAPVVLFELR